MIKKILILLSMCSMIFVLTSCGGETEVTTPVLQDSTPQVDYGQYSKIEIEPKEFTWGTYDLLYTNKTFPYILNDYELILSTSSDMDRFPEIKELMTIKNTNPQLLIIPKHFQIQYTISEITCKNGVITILYETENNIKIDRIIGQIYDVPYTFSYIDLGILPDGKYRVEFKDKNKNFNDITKEINIIIPKLITEWQVRNIYNINNKFLTYASNKTGSWQVYRYNLENKENIQISSHENSEISGYNDLGYQNNNINIPLPRYNNSLNSIYYALNADIYRYEDLGDNTFRKFNISINTFQTNIPNEYNAFEKAPKLSSSGYKYLFLEVSDPTMSELYVGETFTEGKKRKIPLPSQGKVDFFDWGKTESEYVVIISPNTNERVNGSSSVWVLNDNPNKKNINIKTFGHKIHSAQISNSRKFMIFSQKLSSVENYKNYDLYYVNLNNTNLERITPKDDLMDINPVISPNDKKIAYMSSEDGQSFKLFVANIDGTDRRQVSDMYISDIPCWLNDTEIIVADPFANVFKINTLTGDNELLIDGYDKLDIEKEMEKLEQQKISN